MTIKPIMDELLARTLAEIEGDDSRDPEFDSYLVATIHRLRRKPIGEFSIEDLRITIGQSVGLPHLVPLAIAHLERDPFVEGDFYAGDLLRGVLQVDDAFWASHRTLRDRLLAVVTVAAETSDDAELRGLCASFVSRWMP